MKIAKLSVVFAMAAALLFSSTIALGHTASWPAKRLAALYPEADSYKQVKKRMSVKQVAKIKHASGAQFNKWDETPSFYVPIGKKENGKKGSLALIYILDAKGANGSIEMGVTVTLKGKIIRVVLFENKESRAINSADFLDGFTGLTVTKESYKTVDELKGEQTAPGQFKVGNDIAAPPGEETSAQTIATAVKKSLLMMKELF
jgi:hypothetical protein